MHHSQAVHCACGILLSTAKVCRIARTTELEESEHMSGTNIENLKERSTNDVYQDEHKTHMESQGCVNSSVSRFPSVESVLIDIDGFLETHGRVA